MLAMLNFNSVLPFGLNGLILNDTFFKIFFNVDWHYGDLNKYPVSFVFKQFEYDAK